MRPFLRLVILAGLALGLAAGAGAAGRRAVTAPGSSAPASAVSPAVAAQAPLQSPIPSTGSAFAARQGGPVSEDDCRLSCSRGYYFCLQGEEPDTCSDSWVQCRSTCIQPTPAFADRP